MAAPPYAQAVMGANHFQPAAGSGYMSDGYQSSIPDTSTIMAPSESDEDALSGLGLTGRPSNPSSAGLESNTDETTSPNRRTSIPKPSPRTPVMVASPTQRDSPRRSIYNNKSDSEVYSSGHSRAASSYSLSRVSFASQFAQLTAIQLPSASSLSARISSQETAHRAARALQEAGDQISVWVRKASEVLDDLDAKDDVDWAAAGGREGLEDVDAAITRFEGLVKVYVISMEELQLRRDITTLSDETLRGHVYQMEGIIKDWQNIKESLKGIKEQVEIAMEWEELWNTVLGVIGQELDRLGELVFEMEEKRHRSAGINSLLDTSKNIDISDLANIVEGKSAERHTQLANRSSFPPPFSPGSPVATPKTNKEDSSLLALFARMQPLRASLDFMPMRLSVFHVRGNVSFPSACVDLEQRRDALEEQWKKLETDAEALRKELGEDRWVLVFRNAGKQALKMFESVERTHDKLKDAYAADVRHSDPSLFARTVESYEAKKLHYVPAVERVLAIIDRGVMDRLTVNGEILRLQSDMKRRWAVLQSSLRDMDARMEETSLDGSSQQLRDSISTIVSTGRSLTSSTLDTPRSSPASSVVGQSRKSSFGTMTPTGSGFNVPKTRTSAIPRATPTSAARGLNAPRSISSPVPRLAEPFHDKKEALLREFKDPPNKPRWNAGSVTTGSPLRRDFPPLSATEPSPYRKPATFTPRKYTPTKLAQDSNIPTPTTRNYRAVSPSPDMLAAPSTTRRSSLLGKLPPRASSAMDNRSFSTPQRLQQRTSSSYLQTITPSRRTSHLLHLPTVADDDGDADSEAKANTHLNRPSSRASRISSRPPSSLSTATPGGRKSSLGASHPTRRRGSLANSTAGGQAPTAASRRRSSIIQTPHGIWSRGNGRDSRAGSHSEKVEEEPQKPKWR